jgi:hypothetical protein
MSISGEGCTVGHHTSRFAVEHSLVSDLTMLATLSPAELRGVVGRHPELARAHIYAVCTRPKITVPSEGVRVTDDSLRITFRAQVRERWREITFGRPNTFDIPGLRVESAWPHTNVVFRDGDGEERLQATAALLLTSFVADPNFEVGDDVHEEYLDLDVEYVGRAYSQSGRNAVDRLMNHETLQRVQADVAAKRPDREIWLVPMAFDAYSMIGEFGLWAGVATDEEEMAHAKDIDTYPVSEKERVALTEGALIRYFDPPYNKNLKQTFPSSAHRDYTSIYTRELIGAGFDLESTSVGTRLGSAARPAAWAHGHVFSLRSEGEKKSLLDLADAAAI